MYVNRISHLGSRVARRDGFQHASISLQNQPRRVRLVQERCVSSSPYYQGGGGGLPSFRPGSSIRSFTSQPGGGYRERLPLNLGFVIVPQQKLYVIERLGKFSRTLPAGLHFLIPFVDRIAYVHSLKETAQVVPSQTAITRDNVTITIDGVLYIRITDAHAASYGVSDPIFALTQLAQTTMRSELGKITLDKTFEERETLNANIVATINQASKAWGTECLRYEIKDIIPPVTVKTAMDSLAEAERKKRTDILTSEGEREAEINRAEGARRATVLQAQGEAEAILARASASAAAVEVLAAASRKKGGRSAVAMRVAEQYVEAFGKIAKRGNTIVIPADVGNVPSMVAQALSVFEGIKGSTQGGKRGGGGLGSGALADAGGDDGDDDSNSSSRSSAGAAADADDEEKEDSAAAGAKASTVLERLRSQSGSRGSGDIFKPSPYPDMVRR